MVNPSIPEIYRRHRVEVDELKATIARLEAEVERLRPNDAKAKRAAYQREYRARLKATGKLAGSTE